MGDNSPSGDDTLTADGSSTDNDDRVIPLLREARLAFGAVLVENESRLVECLNRERFTDNDPETVLATAVTSANADLVPFITERRDETENRAGDTTQGKTDGEIFDPPEIDSFEELISAIEAGHTFYLVSNRGPREWNRVRHTEADEMPRYRVADTVVTAATERIAGFPESVDRTNIEIINWNG